MQHTNFSIAIDGPAGAGKSTVARAVADRLGAHYLDTGAMYRAAGLYMHEHGIETPEDIAVHACDPDISICFQDGVQHTLLGGEDVTRAIRAPEASLMASRVGSVAAIRRRMVELQRAYAKGHDVVMDGRDIGTDVLPDATLKVFLTASPEVRAKRRYAELQAKGASDTYEKVLAEIIQRDYDDSHRAASPMRQANDAMRVDSSDMTPEQVVDTIVNALRGREVHA
ncbi:MAG: (d)CMP kinase [Clostridiales bacterium]|nr:(d)CMP kinase [Clostridiales bacterium]MBE5807602.1 (d)CMP kinase [Clostridiales bacterium]